MTRRRGRDQNAPVFLVTAAMELRDGAMQQIHTYVYVSLLTHRHRPFELSIFLSSVHAVGVLINCYMNLGPNNNNLIIIINFNVF